MDTGTFNLYDARLETTDYGKVLQDVIRKDGFSKNIIENYNNEIINRIPEIITSTTFPIKKGTISFENVSFEKPMEAEKELYPRKSREKIIPYFATLKFKVVFRPRSEFTINGVPHYRNDEKEESEEIREKCIPVMLGSDLCYLSGKTPEEKVQMGECFNDPFGYFIAKSERTILNIENLRTSVFFINNLPASDMVEGRITCLTTLGSMVTYIYITKDKKIQVLLQHLRNSKKNNIIYLPILQVFRVLGMERDDAIDLILSFFDNEADKTNAYFNLTTSIFEYDNIAIGGDDSQEVMINNIYERRRKNDKNVTLESIKDNIERDLLANIPDVNKKLIHLAMYTSRMVGYMIGIRSVNDRDSWSNKRISTPGRSIYQLFKTIWTQQLIPKLIKNTRDAVNLRDVVSKINLQSEIRETFITSFGSSSWGPKNSGVKENIVDSLKRETPLAVFAQIGRIKPPSSSQSKSVEPRMPHGTQWGYICCYETPEGEGCGIVKNSSVSAYISLERDPKPIIEILHTSKKLKDCFFTERISEDLYPVLVNGVIEGWCIPDLAEPILKSFKASGKFYMDTCVFKNITDRTMEIFCDGCRPVRPLFVVDKDGVLMIDKKKLWNASIEELVRQNCLEYVDCREQEWLILAESVEKVRMDNAMLSDAERLKNLKELTEEDQANLENINTYFKDFAPYTHCEIDPTAMFSIATNMVPQANRNAGPRIATQASMSRQALTQYHSSEFLRFDASYKMVYFPNKPIFQTDIQDTAGLNLMPNGLTLNLAYMMHPDNPEDGIIIKEEAITYNNKFDFCKKFVITASLENSSSSSIYEEAFARPVINPKEPPGKYDAITEQGIPRLDAYIRPGDAIICKVKKYRMPYANKQPGDVEPVTICAGIGEEGYIDRVLITVNRATNQTMVRVKIRQNRKYIPGDKIACMTPDHETLTRNRGWVNITDVKLTDEVATLDTFNNTVYQNPTTLHNYCYEGVVYHIENEFISTTISPRHRLLYSRDGKGWSIANISEISRVPYFWLRAKDTIFRVDSATDIKMEKYTGSIHCITIPNSIFLIRRNGKEHWTGNSRYSQKGTISRIIPARNMPRIASGPLKGMTPDIIINPINTSRMTIAKFVEILTSKAAAIDGNFVNATTFRNFEDNLVYAQKVLESYGLDPNGKEEMELPNGKKLQNKIYFGPCFYQALRQHVSDKIQMRARKGIKPATQQPVQGRANEGGIRFGEMERDSLISHGASALLRERLCDVSDVYNLPICQVCGTIAITDYEDGNKCNLCGDKAKFGVIRIPYVLKLLLFYLNAIGISMTFKTSEIISPNGRIEEKFLI